MSEEIQEEICAKCGVLGRDRRTLWMACFYEMTELGIPLKEIGLHGVVLQTKGERTQWGPSRNFEAPPYGDDLQAKSSLHRLYTMRVCKSCRSGWLDAIRNWYRGPVSESHAWNCDEAGYISNDSLPGAIAELERLRTEVSAVEQRVALLLVSAKKEEQRREQEDSAGRTP